jgi:hypothetical protein
MTSGARRIDEISRTKQHVVLPNGWRSAAADLIRLRAGHERSECLRAFRSSTVCCNAR